MNKLRIITLVATTVLLSAQPVFAVSKGDAVGPLYLIGYLNDRQNAIMNGIAAGLSEEDMHDLAAYFSSQSGLAHLPKP